MEYRTREELEQAREDQLAHIESLRGRQLSERGQAVSHEELDRETKRFAEMTKMVKEWESREQSADPEEHSTSVEGQNNKEDGAEQMNTEGLESSRKELNLELDLDTKDLDAQITEENQLLSSIGEARSGLHKGSEEGTASSSDDAEHFRKRIAELEASNQEKVDKLAVLEEGMSEKEESHQSALAKLQEENEQALTENQSLDIELQALKEQLLDSQQQENQLRDDCDQLAQQLEDLENENNEKDEKLEHQAAMISQLKDDNAKLKQAKDELEEVKGSYEDLQEDHKKLEQEADGLRTASRRLQHQLSAANDEKCELGREWVRLSQDLESLEQSSKDAQDKQEKRVNELEADLDESCRQLSNYQKQISKLEEEKADLESEYDRQEAHTGELERTVERQKVEILDLHSKLSESKAHAESAKHDAMEVSSVVDQLRETCKILETERSSLKQDLEKKAKELVHAQAELSDAQTESEAFSASLEKWKEHGSTLEAQLVHQKKELEKVKAASSPLNDQMKNDQSWYAEQLQNAKRKLRVAQDELLERKQSEEIWHRKFDELKERAMASRKVSEDISAKAEALRAEVMFHRGNATRVSALTNLLLALIPIVAASSIYFYYNAIRD